MCKKVNNKKVPNTRIDRCIKPLIKWLLECDFAPVASCCGHNKYPITVVVRWMENGVPTYYELFTKTKIPRSRNFYKKDSEGYYYIPEVSGNSFHN